MEFEQSKQDPCLFMHREKQILLLLCTDDVLLFSKSNEDLDAVLAELRNKFSLTEEDQGKDAFAHLGIDLKFATEPNGKRKVTMAQDGLLKKIFEKTEWGKLTGCRTPAKEKALGADLEGAPHSEPWECASVIGSLMFLVNTRCDIQFAVHQCARFTHNPKESHTNAIKKIM